MKAAGFPWLSWAQTLGLLGVDLYLGWTFQ